MGFNIEIHKLSFSPLYLDSLQYMNYWQSVYNLYIIRVAAHWLNTGEGDYLLGICPLPSGLLLNNSWFMVTWKCLEAFREYKQ